MFYNCENLFDTINDPVTDDNEFTPSGIRGWTWYKYRKKINSVFKVIAASGEWTPPDIIALCEVENRRVIDDLLNSTNLSKFNYKIIHKDSPDLRGIDVAILYNDDLLDLDHREFIDPRRSIGDLSPTREILYAKFIIEGFPFHILVNHWPSSRGGVGESAELRFKVAGVVKDIVDSVMVATGEDEGIIITGDLNCEYTDFEIRKGFETDKGIGDKFQVLEAGKPDKTISGTYKFRGLWYNYDNIIISKALYTKGSLSYKTGSFKIMKEDFLLEKDPDYPGVRPFSTFRGLIYEGGFSDHLPVIADFTINR